jgi:predicted DNA-binding transcriptional regulator AlpA
MTDDEKHSHLAKFLNETDRVRRDLCGIGNDPLTVASMPERLRKWWDFAGDKLREIENLTVTEMLRLKAVDCMVPVARAEKAEAEVAELKARIMRLGVANREWQDKGGPACIACQDKADAAEKQSEEWKALVAMQEGTVANLKAEVARLKVEADANTWVYKESEIVKLKAKVAGLEAELSKQRIGWLDDVTRLQTTADVAMRRTLKAEEEVKALRALCGEVAEWLQISTVQLWRLTNVQGVIPYVRIGTKGIRFREADIEEYLAKGMNKAR